MTSRQFLSTPSARRATALDLVTIGADDDISIHALREEGDCGSLAGLGGHSISIHALREEGDAVYYIRLGASKLFLSTPSARRATGIVASTQSK